MPVFVSSQLTGDLALDIARGSVSGFSSVNKFGRTSNADADVATDIWDGANATDDIDEWVAPTQARTHAIVSSSTSDTSGGAGARTIRIYGLTDWDTKETSEVVTLNGTTPVNTANSYVIIHRMKVLTAGASGPNVGYIDATAATDATITAMILPLEGQTQMAVYGIPSTQTAYVTGFYASVLSGTNKTCAANVALLWTPDVENQEGVFQVKHTRGIYDPGETGFQHFYNPYNGFSGPGIFKLEATTDQNNSDVSGGFDIILEDA
jgi:hypothetical protein